MRRSLSTGGTFKGYALGTGNYTISSYKSTTYRGTTGNDVVVGDDTDQILDGSTSGNGGQGNDLLFGNGGNDILIGGVGTDLLVGGTGRDVFVFTAGDSGQSTGNIDVIADYLKGLGTGDLIDYSANLTIGGTAITPDATHASINQTTGVATFASGSGMTLADALADIALEFTAASNASGEFALFQTNNTGDYYMFISDGSAGVTANDEVIQFTDVTIIGSIDLTGGNLTIVS